MVSWTFDSSFEALFVFVFLFFLHDSHDGQGRHLSFSQCPCLWNFMVSTDLRFLPIHGFCLVASLCSFWFQLVLLPACFSVSMNVGPANLYPFHVRHESVTQRPKAKKFVSRSLLRRGLLGCQTPRVLHSPSPVEPGVVLLWQMQTSNLRKVAWFVYICAATGSRLRSRAQSFWILHPMIIQLPHCKFSLV